MSTASDAHGASCIERARQWELGMGGLGGGGCGDRRCVVQSVSRATDMA